MPARHEDRLNAAAHDLVKELNRSFAEHASSVTHAIATFSKAVERVPNYAPVPECDGCPACGQRDRDRLIWQDEGVVRCAYCTYTYVPGETVTFGWIGQRFRRCSNMKLPDIKVGVWNPLVTPIYKDHMGRVGFEGEAILFAPDRQRCSTSYWAGVVQFIHDEPGQHQDRIVWRRATRKPDDAS